MAKRKLENWVDSWMEFTDPLPSPTLWRKWASIALIAGALERKVWIRTGIAPLYPNLYTVFVGPPGLGKTILTNTVWEFWNSLDDGTDRGLRLAASSVTSASLIDELHDAKRHVVDLASSSPVEEFNSLAICSNELGVFLPEWDGAFMSILTDIYDGHPYGSRRRTKDIKLKIAKPQFNIIAATTPSWLMGTLPPGAWDQGFLSRTLLAFSSENLRRPIFSQLRLDNTQRDTLLFDLRSIFELSGPFEMEPDALEALERWYEAGGPPAPDHPKLMHYLTRRHSHLLKLCMVASAAEGNTRRITRAHLDRALDWLLELEVYLPDIFKAMVVGGDGQAMQETWYHFSALWAKEQRPIHEGRIVAFLAERLPAHSVVRVLDVMERSGMLKEELTAAGKAYVPRPRKM